MLFPPSLPSCKVKFLVQSSSLLFPSYARTTTNLRPKVTMCNKLLKTFACGHSRSICTTPCSHALKSTETAPNLNIAANATVVRSDSIVSAIAPVSGSPSRNFSRPHPSNNSPLRSSTSLPLHHHLPASQNFALSRHPPHLPPRLCRQYHHPSPTQRRQAASLHHRLPLQYRT